jgi:hypothetical protein
MIGYCIGDQIVSACMETELVEWKHVGVILFNENLSVLVKFAKE